MLGFDLWGTNSAFNNVYKSTEHYNDKLKPATDQVIGYIKLQNYLNIIQI